MKNNRHKKIEGINSRFISLARRVGEYFLTPKKQLRLVVSQELKELPARYVGNGKIELNEDYIDCPHLDNIITHEITHSIQDDYGFLEVGSSEIIEGIAICVAEQFFNKGNYTQKTLSNLPEDGEYVRGYNQATGIFNVEGINGLRRLVLAGIA